MELTKEMKDTIIGSVSGLVGSLATAGLVAAADALLPMLTAIDYTSNTMAGETSRHPTKSDISVNQSGVSAKDTDAALAKDAVKVKDGDLSAAQTDAKAMTSDVKALDSGASAAQPKAGALDVKTKGLVMS
jgi:hypothetical protein